MTTQSRLKELFSYDQDTGQFIRIGLPKKGTAELGKVCGIKDAHGYLNISIDGKKYKAHRLVFLYVFGEIPGNGVDIDHVNRVRDDNRLINLRLASRSENMLNSSKKANNSSGIKGITWSKNANKWRAKAQLNGKHIHIGYFSTKELAQQAYKTYCIENHKEFFNAN